MFTFLAMNDSPWLARFWHCNGWDRWMALDTMFMLNDLEREAMWY